MPFLPPNQQCQSMKCWHGYLCQYIRTVNIKTGVTKDATQKWSVYGASSGNSQMLCNNCAMIAVTCERLMPHMSSAPGSTGGRSRPTKLIILSTDRRDLHTDIQARFIRCCSNTTAVSIHHYISDTRSVILCCKDGTDLCNLCSNKPHSYKLLFKKLHSNCQFHMRSLSSWQPPYIGINPPQPGGTRTPSRSPPVSWWSERRTDSSVMILPGI